MRREALRDRALVALQLAVGAVVTLIVILASPDEGDPNVFLSIANRIAEGQIPYADFALEYPPLALLPLALPRLVAGAAEYQTAFSLVSFVFTIWTAAAVAAVATRGFSSLRAGLAVGVFAGLVLAASPSVIWRFDIAPALMTALALLAVAWRRPAWAGFALAIGVGIKLYPGFLLPVFFGYYAFQRKWRSAAFLLVGFAIPTVALLAQVLLVAGPAGLSYLSYQGDRGIEIESIIGGLAMLADALGGPQARVGLGFGAWQVTSPVVDALAVPGFLFQVVAGIALIASALLAVRADLRAGGRIEPRTLVVYLLATLLLVMLANKVLSNQYVAWLLPFGALLPARQSVVLLAICALTTFVYPMNFDDLLAAKMPSVAALNIRNLLLFVLFAWLVARPLLGRALLGRPPRVGSERRYVRHSADEPGGDAEHQ